MTPHRRQLLTALGTTGVAALAGCSSPGGTESILGTNSAHTEPTARLAAADGDSNDQFGREVAVSADGTTALVGNPEDENRNGENAGAAYVFERTGGSWAQQAKLRGGEGDRFGGAVAVGADGTIALVGAGNDDPNGEHAGAAFVFERTGGSWHRQAKLTASDGDSFDSFGDAVATLADGTTALVGAADDEDPNGDGAGAAYVFDRAALGASSRNSRPQTGTRSTRSASRWRWRPPEPPLSSALVTMRTRTKMELERRTSSS